MTLKISVDEIASIRVVNPQLTTRFVSISDPVPNPIPIPNRNRNITISLTLSQPNAKPDARTKKYLAIVCNYYSTKTADLEAKHKYTTKANL